MEGLSTATAPDAATRTGPRRTRRFAVSLSSWRIVATLHGVVLLTQPVSIGQYLGGLYEWLGVHGNVAVVVLALGALTGLGSVAYVLTGGRPWVLLACVPLFFVEGLQIGLGHAGTLALHVPLGVLLVLVGVGMAGYAWSPAAGRMRAQR